MTTTQASSERDFCHIRMIAGRQVLAYVECDNDELALHILFKFNGGTNADMALKFDEDEEAPYESLREFIAGEHDNLIAKQIASCERDFITERA